LTDLPTVTPPAEWTPGPLHPQLDEGTVHVWRADLTTVPDDPCGLLCSDERRRAARFQRDHDGRLWARSRGALRVLLGRYLQCDPSSPRLLAGEHGKPAVLEDQALFFNLSHSDGLALYVFAKHSEVGIDVELPRRAIDRLAIARRAFGPEEVIRLEGLDAATQEHEFLRAWVRYEAASKCLGLGIGGTHTRSGGQEPWIADLDIGRRGAGAVAAKSTPSQLHCWNYPSYSAQRSRRHQ
jgi:4'-phosphopantetheinyl transferase